MKIIANFFLGLCLLLTMVSAQRSKNPLRRVCRGLNYGVRTRVAPTDGCNISQKKKIKSIVARTVRSALKRERGTRMLSEIDDESNITEGERSLQSWRKRASSSRRGKGASSFKLGVQSRICSGGSRFANSANFRRYFQRLRSMLMQKLSVESRAPKSRVVVICVALSTPHRYNDLFHLFHPKLTVFLFSKCVVDDDDRGGGGGRQQQQK